MQSILTVLVTLVLLPGCLLASNGDDCHTLREASFLSHLPNAFIPRCEKDGTYSAVQCHANNHQTKSFVDEYKLWPKKNIGWKGRVSFDTAITLHSFDD